MHFTLKTDAGHSFFCPKLLSSVLVIFNFRVYIRWMSLLATKNRKVFPHLKCGLLSIFFPNIPELWPIWVGIYKSFQYTLMIQMPSCFLNAHVTHIERLLQLSRPWKVDGDEDELMISKKPRKNAHHYSSSFLYA